MLDHDSGCRPGVSLALLRRSTFGLLQRVGSSDVSAYLGQFPSLIAWTSGNEQLAESAIGIELPSL